MFDNFCVRCLSFFCDENDWSLYYKLIAEIRELNDQKVQGSEFISWHEGAHLIVKNPLNSPTFLLIQEKIANYFKIANKTIGTRFNWYRDSSDFKPFHHDSYVSLTIVIIDFILYVFKFI